LDTPADRIMDPEQVNIRLGDEFDEDLRVAVRGVLADLGAEVIQESWGLGGSQEIASLQTMVDGKLITFEAETYVGVTISGDKIAVERLVGKIRARLGK
jgi:hypothetical protein